MQRKAREADRLCLTQLHTLFEGMLPSSLAAYKAAQGSNSRHRIYTPQVTFWAFLSQTLDADGSCRRAVTRVQTLCSALGLVLPDEDTGAYCAARARLPMRLLLNVHAHVVGRLGTCSLSEGRRVLVMDGTSIRMPDSQRNAAVYARGPGQKPGCGFPLMPVLGLFDLSGGTWIAAVKSKPRAHDAALAWRMLRHLRSGDILIADRAFGSYAFIAACKARGIDVVMRLHQARDPQLAKGRRVGEGDWHVTWNRPLQPPKGQHKALHAALPTTLNLRLVQVRSTSPGFRTHELQVVTTLRDLRVYSAAQIAAWYQRRWQVELLISLRFTLRAACGCLSRCARLFDDIKTSLNMHAFRCKTPHMVARELLMHMIAYNLVRHLMACAEPMRDVQALGTLSFKGTMDRLDQWQWVIWSAPSCKQARLRRNALLQTIADDEVPPRPGRKEPRVCKDRQNKYTFMTKPRHLYNLEDDLAHAS
ncbi:MAG: IS4 family transposase [Prosthecobacter sp.]